MKQSNFEERLHHAIENRGTRPQFLYDDRDLTGFESSMDLLSSKMLKKAEDQNSKRLNGLIIWVFHWYQNSKNKLTLADAA